MRKLLLLLCIVSLTSCKTVLLNMVGVKWPPKEHSNDALIDYASQLNIDKGAIFRLDTLALGMGRAETDSLTKIEKNKRYFSPVQARYYDSKGSLQSLLTLAHLSPLPAEWEKDGTFNSYPPKTHVERDSLTLDFEELEHLLRPLNETESMPLDKPIVVVYWSRTFWKESRRLVPLVQENAKQNGADQNLHIIYVNTDDIVMEFEIMN